MSETTGSLSSSSMSSSQDLRINEAMVTFNFSTLILCNKPGVNGNGFDASLLS